MSNVNTLSLTSFEDFWGQAEKSSRHSDDRSNGAHTERSIGAPWERREDADVVAGLQATIDTLQGQLAVKDRQIEKLTEALVAAQQTAAAAQALHAGTIQQQIITGANEEGQQDKAVVTTQKKGWLGRLFQK